MTASGQRFGKYSLVIRLAAGGQGEIYLARQEGVAGFEKLVVIKRLLPHLAEDPHFARMLVDEARIAARLDHVNVCQVFELGQVDSSYYLAMEYLEGVPLSRMLQRAADSYRLLDIRLVVAILQQACEGLHHAHELRDAEGELIGVVHRDVSPSNLFVTVDGYVKVLDFGVAKARGMESRTRTGTIKGKYEYMSPEQVLRRPLDRRSDVFSLGIVLYEALAVQRLFYRESEFDVFRAITDEPIPPLGQRRDDVPPALEEVARRALSRDVATRFSSARELRRALIDASASLGPPLSEEAIGEHVRTHFQDELEARRDMIAAGIARLDRGGRKAESLSTPSPSSRPRRSFDGGAIGLDDTVLGDVTPAPAQRRAPGRRSRRLAIWGLLAALAAVVGAGVGLVYRAQSSAPTPLMIVRGIVTDEDGVRHQAPQDDPYAGVFAAYQPEVQRCFVDHAMDTERPSAVVMSIDPEGAVIDAWVEPRHLTAAPVGECMRAVAVKARFGAQDQPKVVRIAIRVR